ncbi:hypothetical protein N9B57_03725 [Verrucomicrobia bacterium]|jgi:hypothetical protein|nr:hypothetical protein [Verrucomicrobiota bacterium]MDA7867026.1 hypothetical protein [Verrucomicrobiota bacterium]
MSDLNKSLSGTFTGGNMMNNNLNRTPIDRILSTIDMRTKLILLVVLTGLAVWISVSSLPNSQPKEIDRHEKEHTPLAKNQPTASPN